MPISQAEIVTSNAARTARRLAKHWSHRFTVQSTESSDVIDFGDSTCELRAKDDRLNVIVRTDDAAGIAGLEEVVAEHLQRMASGETLTIQWRRGAE